MSNNRTVHYKKVFSTYHIFEYDDSIDVDFYVENILRNSYRSSKIPKYGYFMGEKRHQVDEEQFLKHYGDKTVGVETSKITLVIEEYDDKLSLKLYETHKSRRVGGTYFRIRRILTYLTYNLKTKNFYFGEIEKKNKKVISKKIRTNDFSNSYASSFKLKIRRYVRDITSGPEVNYVVSTTSGDKISDEVIKVFTNILGNRTGIYLDNLRKFDVELFRFYLEHNGFKYPNTYYEYNNIRFEKRELRKHINIVTLIMNQLELGGKRVKKLLNQLNNIDLTRMAHLYHLLGVDYFNMLDEHVFVSNEGYTGILHLKNFNTYKSNIDFDITKRDKMRIVNVLNNNIRFSLILDHLKIIDKLKKEYDYEYKMSFTDRHSFDHEHYEISNLLDSYSKGVVTRSYGDHFKEKIEEVIYGMDGGEYYPVVLLSTDDYNKESAIQNNCVRTYVEKPQSLIISLREGSVDGKDRATIEYLFRRNAMIRIQSLGKFNKDLSPRYSAPIEILDELVNKLYKKDILHLPIMKKEYKNGKIIRATALFEDEDKSGFFSGNPVWDNEEIKEEDFFDFDLFQ